MKTNKLVIPLILLIMSWVNWSQALQEAPLLPVNVTNNMAELLLPKLAMGLTDTLAVPVDVVGLNNEEVYSIYLKIALDTTIVQVEDVLTGSLTVEWNNPIWHVVNGQLRISHYGLTPFTGSGNSLNILLTAKGEENSSTELSFVLGALNEGTPQTTLVDGRVFIGTPYPVISEITTTDFNENDNISIPITVSDPLDKELTLQAVNLPQGAVFTDNGDGTASINWASDYYSAGEYNITISATNEDTLSSQVEFNLIIVNIPQPPLFITPFEDITFAEDTSFAEYYLTDYVADSDLNQGDTLFVNLEEEANIYLNFNDNLLSFSARENWFGRETINIVISDSYGFEINQQVEVNVENVNDEPVQLQALPEITIDEDYLDYTLNLNDYFFDLDNLLVYAITGAENIDYSVEGGVLSLQPHLDWYGSETIQLITTEASVINLDGEVIASQISENLSIINELTIVVNPVNDAPVVLNQLPEVKMLVNTSSTLEDVDSYFADVDSDLVYSFAGNNNLAIYYLDNTFQITPSLVWVGVERVTVTATDDYNLSVSQVLVIRSQVGYLLTEDFNHSGTFPTDWSATGGDWVTQQDAGVDWSIGMNNPRISRIQRLTSKAYDLSGIYDVEISFWHSLLRPSGVTPILQYSLNGFTYSNIESFAQSTSGVYSIFLPQVNNSANVRFRWQYLSTTVAANYWNIDDFDITGVLGNYLPPAPVQNLQLISVSPQELTFSWLPIENNFFNQYEISVMSQASLTDQLFIWNGNNDDQLYSQEIASTTITGLTSNQVYYFAIRSTDMSGNTSAWSEIIAATPTALPLITFITGNDTWFASQEPVIQLQIEDDVMVDAGSLEYRLDANNNGIYDEDEVWQPIDDYLDSNEIDEEFTLNLESDGVGYRVEVRCYDTQNSIYSYSGTNSQAGIDDDLSFNIDTVKPEVIVDLVTSELSPNSVTLEWLTYNEEDFSHYEIYYSANYDLSLEANLFSTESDINLNNRLTASTTITGLDIDQRYWFAIIAVDFAGNRGDFSNIVTNVLASDLVIISDAYPLQIEPQAYANSRQIQLGCKLKDAYGVDYSLVQYRIDANGNGLYDANEEWLNVYSNGSTKMLRNNSGTMNEAGDFVLEVQIDVVYLTDGEELKFEFRAKDISGFGYAYSGFESSEGIADDWSVNIDSVYPTEITNIVAGLITSSTAEVAWTSSQDANFVGYKIFYGEDANITLEDDYVSWLDYPELANPGAGQVIFTLPNLNPNIRYYLKIAAVDIAGNTTFSEVISFLTVNDSKPKKPENVTITFDGSDLILSWDSVTEDTNGNPIADVIYDIYLSETPEFELDGSNYYDTAYENQYRFYGMGQALPMIFFRVQAFSD